MLTSVHHRIIVTGLGVGLTIKECLAVPNLEDEGLS